MDVRHAIHKHTWADGMYAHVMPIFVPLLHVDVFDSGVWSLMLTQNSGGWDREIQIF